MLNARRVVPAFVSFLAAAALFSSSASLPAQTLLPDLVMLQPNEFRLELLGGGVRRV